MKKYFGTDGIRGRVGIEPITVDFLLKLGWVVGSVLSSNGQANIIIGKDTRVSGYMFESALEAGFLASGINVGLLGPMPTPAVAYLAKIYNSAGVVISASHNPYQDNGVKFFTNNGFKISKEQQDAIEIGLNKKIISINSKNIGKAKRCDDALRKYIDFCKSTCNLPNNIADLKIVIDCANGANYNIAESVFRELGANIILINNTPDGYNINLNCGVTDTKNLQETVINNKANLGIAFDGDGDRVLMIDDKGELVEGDELVFIIAKDLKKNNKLKSDIVIGTKMSNSGMRESLKNLGIKFIEADVGDRFVVEQIQKYNASLGGENSGHIICKDKTTSGDGIIAALQILEIICNNNKSLYQLKKDMLKYPQASVEIKRKKIDVNNNKLKQTILELEQYVTRIVVRNSGTEPLVRIMVEAEDYKTANKYAQYMLDFVKDI